jgi:hypothetical protein
MTISWVQIKSGLISGLITAILATFVYIIGVGSVFNLNLHSMVNVFTLALLVSIVSWIKSFLTTSDGKALGVTVVAPTN